MACELGDMDPDAAIAREDRGPEWCGFGNPALAGTEQRGRGSAAAGARCRAVPG